MIAEAEPPIGDSFTLAGKQVLIVGMGGLGCPVAMALARAGVGTLHLVDDDLVDESNLHRQILYNVDDIGQHKLDCAQRALSACSETHVVLHRTRLLPENARQLIRPVDLVVEGADNFATKFLAADASYLEDVPIVHGAAVRFIGTALSVHTKGAPCYRCVFEDLLDADETPNCSSAGVMGPVVGVVGALMADLALDILQDSLDRVGQIYNFDGHRQILRPVRLRARPSCRLCGSSKDQITALSRELYGATPMAAPSYAGQRPLTYS